MAKGCCEEVQGCLRPSEGGKKKSHPIKAGVIAFATEIRGQVSRASSSIKHKAGKIQLILDQLLIPYTPSFLKKE